jgi:predicted HTH domain antitoxin
MQADGPAFLTLRYTKDQEVIMEPETILTIPKDILESSRLSVDELKQELAVSLYAQGRLSIGKARELAGMSLVAFRHLLAARQIPPHYGEEGLEEDLETLDGPA